MFVKSKETCKFEEIGKVVGGTLFALLSLNSFGITPAFAADAPSWKVKDGTIPVTVTLQGITETKGPIYVSIQTRENYRSMKGHGGIISEATLGDMTATFNVTEPGEYSVSVWHDLDDDGRFSMTETYKVLDGWGASGTPPENQSPTFDDVKVKVESFGATVPVAMKYPS